MNKILALARKEHYGMSKMGEVVKCPKCETWHLVKDLCPKCGKEVVELTSTKFKFDYQAQQEETAYHDSHLKWTDKSSSASGSTKFERAVNSTKKPKTDEDDDEDVNELKNMPTA